MADDWDQWVDKLVGGLPDAEDEEAPVPSPVVHPVKPQSPPQRGDSPEVFSGSGAMVDAHEEWIKEQANSLESSTPIKAGTVRRKIVKPAPQPAPLTYWERKELEKKSQREPLEPFFFTDIAARAGQIASVISAVVLVISYFAAHASVEYLPNGRPSTAAPDLGVSVGMLASCVVSFALCGGVRCLVVLSREKLEGKSPSNQEAKTES